MSLSRNLDPILLLIYEEKRSLTFNSLHHQVIPAGVVQAHLRTREPGKVNSEQSDFNAVNQNRSNNELLILLLLILML